MFNRGLLVLIAAAVVTTACGDPNPCQSNADCAVGQACDLDVNQCYTPTVVLCERDCGDGFFCQTLAGQDVCTVEEGKEGVAALRAPAAGAVTGPAKIAVTCEARAPQFGELVVSVKTPADKVEALTATRRSGTDLFDATFDAEPETVVDGEYEFGCALTYGPEGATIEAKSAPAKLLLDRVAPTITITPITTWQSRSGTTTVTAKIVDQGGTAAKKAGIDGPTVKLVAGGKTYPGTSGAGDTWTFAVSPAEITTNTIEGELEFTISAADKAGNETSETSAMNVDGSGPTVAMTAPAAWIKRDAASFTVTASADSTGAGVSSVTLTGAGGTPTLTGVLEDDAFHFEITPSQWQTANAETPVPWTLVAVDEAGNEATQEGTFRIDGKGPTLTANAPTDWIGGTHYELSVAASDAASGLVESSVKWSAGGANGECAKESAGQYVCDVTLATAVGSATPSYEITLSAEDLLGNASQSKVALKVDRKGPTVSVESDGKWYGRGETVTVKVSASDSDAGLGGATFFRTTAPKASSTGGTVGASGVTFEVQAADVSLANVTTTSLSAEVEICDSVGNCTKVPANDLFKVDDEAPTITLGNDLTYLSGKGVALRRDPTGGDRAKVTFTATVTDAGSGVASQDVRLAFTGLDGTLQEIAAKSSVGGGVYAFEFDAKDAQFNAGLGNIELRVVATDAVRKEGVSAVVPVATTRELWLFPSGRTSSVLGGVASDSSQAFFTVAGADGMDSNVFAIDTRTGKDLWSVRVTVAPSTQVAVGDGFIYFASNANGGTVHAYKKVYGEEEDVLPVWQCGGIGTVQGALAVAKWKWFDGQVYETVLAASTLNLVTAMRQNGTSCHTRQTGAINGSNPRASTVAVNGSRIWFGTETGKLSAARFDESTGSFEESLSTVAVLGSPVAGAAILKSSVNAVAGHFSELREWDSNRDPGYIGTHPENTFVVRSPPSLFSDDTFFFGTSTGSFYRFDRSSPTPSPGYPKVLTAGIQGSAAIAADGTAYVITEDGKLHSLPNNGSGWTYDLGAGSTSNSSPSLSCDGTLYVGTGDGRVLALVTDKAVGLAESGWPKYQHDNRNTGNSGTSIACPPVP